MASKDIRNVELNEYIKFLVKVGCSLQRQRGGHLIYNRPGLRRPIVVQAHIKIVPLPILKNGLRALSIRDEDFWPILNGEMEYTPPNIPKPVNQAFLKKAGKKRNS